jgi:hypothetical protein
MENLRRRWTIEEVRKLRLYRDKGLSNAEIAKKLDRTVTSIGFAKSKFAPPKKESGRFKKTETSTETGTVKLKNYRERMLETLGMPAGFYMDEMGRFETVSGQIVHIVGTNGVKPHNIMGVVHFKEGGHISMWNPQGKNHAVPAWNLRRKDDNFKIPMWVNVYRAGATYNLGLGHLSKETADAVIVEHGVTGDKVACIKVMVEGKEGDGM